MENSLFEAIEIKTMHDPADFDNATINKEEHLIYGDNSVEQENAQSKTCCEACNKKFTTKDSLKRHYERNQVCKKWKKTKPYSFDIYPKVFRAPIKQKFLNS